MINVRIAKKSDIPKIIPLFKGLMKFHEEYGDYWKLADDAEKHATKHLSSMLKREDSFLLVANDKNKCVGYALIRTVKNPTLSVKKYLYLDVMFIRQEYRRKGIGSEFIKKLISIAKDRKTKFVQLGVAVQNRDAIRLYKKFQFKPKHFTMFLETD